MHPFSTRPLGLFTTGDAARAGFDSYAVTRHVRRGEWERLCRGVFVAGDVFRAADAVERHALRAGAAVLKLVDPVLSHTSAAVLHGLPLLDASLEEVHVTRVGRRGASRFHDGVRHHVCSAQPDERVLRRGLPVTSLERTAFDVARWSDDRLGVVVADAALRAGASADVLRDVLDRARDWPGSRHAAAAILWSDGRSESPGESVSRLTFRRVGLPPDVLQLEVATDSGRFRGDFGWTSWRVLGEFDGRVKYGRLLRPGQDASDVLVAERRREQAIERAGWVVVRFTWAEVHDPVLVRARLVDARRQALVRGLVRA